MSQSSLLWIAMFLPSSPHPDTNTLLSGSVGKEPLQENIVNVFSEIVAAKCLKL